MVWGASLKNFIIFEKVLVPQIFSQSLLVSKENRKLEKEGKKGSRGVFGKSPSLSPQYTPWRHDAALLHCSHAPLSPVPSLRPRCRALTCSLAHLPSLICSPLTSLFFFLPPERHPCAMAELAAVD